MCSNFNISVSMKILNTKKSSTCLVNLFKNSSTLIFCKNIERINVLVNNGYIFTVM